MEELRLKLLWSNLFGLRFILTIMPQYGYINKEEFSDSPQIMAGILGLDPGNINSIVEQDTKSVIFPMLTSGIPFLILRVINDIGIFGNVITPYLVLITPRIWMAFCSILIDIFIYKIAINCGYSSKTALSAMTLFASSYVTWVYLTRTLSIAFETIIFAALLYTARRNAISPPTNKKWNIMLDSSVLASLLALGMCANVKFIDYAVLPIGYWVFFPYSSIMKCFFKSLSFCVSFVIGLFLLSLLDNCYVKTHLLYDVLQYFDTTGLAAFGLQFYVNKPSLTLPNLYIDNINLIPSKTIQTVVHLFETFGPLAVLLFRAAYKGNFFIHLLSKRRDAILIYTILSMTLSMIFCINRSTFQMFAAIVPFIVLVAQYGRRGKLLLVCHCIFNFSGFIYYAVYRYGGATHSMDFFGSMVRTVTHVNQMEVVLFETPILPQYLTALPLGCEYDTSELCIESHHSNIHFTEATMDNLQKTVDDFLVQYPEPMVFLVMPASLPCQLLRKLRILYNLQLFYKFFPHVASIEDIPDYTNLQEWCNSKGGQIETFSELVQDKFALNIYGVSIPAPKRPEIAKKVVKLTLLTDDYSSSI